MYKTAILEVAGIRNQIRLGKFRTRTLQEGPEYFQIRKLPVCIQGYNLIVFWGIFSLFSVQYSALLHLPPLRFHCAGGCWDRTQDH
jgi:hypothetical protein